MRLIIVAAAVLAAMSLAHAQPAATTGQITVLVRDGAGRPVADAVIVAVPADGSLRAIPKAERESEIDQVDKEFMPRVKVVLVGSAVVFPNNDTVRHQVYSFSPSKRFELPLYAGVSPATVVFDKPGVVILGCNIHDWMVGYVYVSESPYYGKTDAAGRTTLADLPPRAYVVRLWHPQLNGSEDATHKQVEAVRGQRVDLAWDIKLKPDSKIRRAPIAGRGGRY